MPGLLLFGFAAGCGITAQAAINAQLRTSIGAPVLAALLSFVVGTLLLAVAVLVTREQPPAVADLRGVPWWAWFGGLLGAVYVLGTIILVPRLGAATTIGVIVAGQLGASIVIDQFGWFRLAQHTASVGRVAGAVLLLAGVVLVQRF